MSGADRRDGERPERRVAGHLGMGPARRGVARLSVVIPAYNEEKVIGDSVAKVARYLAATPEPELIVVDDGSRDRTREIVLEQRREFPFVRLLPNDRNRGKGYSIKHGILATRGDYVLYTDADLVYPIEGVEPFVHALNLGADVAIASRSHPRTLFALHPRHFSYIYQRYLVGRTYINVVNRLLKLGVTDTQAGFKVIRGDAARAIFARTTLYDFAFDVEALFIARQLGYRIVEHPVYFLYLGEQSSVELVQDSLRMLADLVRIRRNGRRGVYLREPRPGSSAWISVRPFAEPEALAATPPRS
jgi:dolichyl-phosphate beta-glucosyltransferase